MFPSKDNVTICFAHAAYQMQARFELRKTGVKSFQAWTPDDFLKRVGEADVVVSSGMWKNEILPHATKLKFIQSISSGMNQYSNEQLAAKGVRLASGAGVNAKAVAEHAIALILAIYRRLPEARDNQHKKMWRGMIGIRRDPAQGENGADAIYGMGDLVELAPQADIVALTCALTPETTGLMSAAAFAAMKPSSVFVNVARGKVADEDALIDTMANNRIWAAALDVTAEEPLLPESPLWTLPNVFVTPHTAGETRAYEDNVIDILIENLERLWKGDKTLRNQVL